jgi:hypothetical protein
MLNAYERRVHGIQTQLVHTKPRNRSGRDCVLTKFNSLGDCTTIDVLGCGSFSLTVAEQNFLARVLYRSSHKTEYGGASNVMHAGTDYVHQVYLTEHIKWSTTASKIVKCENNFSLRKVEHQLR